jgi:hypothetical protein
MAIGSLSIRSPDAPEVFLKCSSGGAAAGIQELFRHLALALVAV